jgi:hypothetical protein
MHDETAGQRCHKNSADPMNDQLNLLPQHLEENDSRAVDTITPTANINN